MTDPLKALFGKPDYSRIVRDTTAKAANRPLPMSDVASLGVFKAGS